MGMFDSFILKAKCPYCGRIEEREFQTKQFNCCMDVWREDEEFTIAALKITNGIIKDVYGSCRHPECGEKWERENNPNCSGFGRSIYADVLIESGIVKKAINIRDDSSEE